MRPWTVKTLAALSVAALLSLPLAVSQQAESQRKVISKVVPNYPELARRMHLEDTVKLMVTVAPNGTVKSTEAVGGSPVLVRAAEDTVYKWRWASAPQESRELVELQFRRNN